MRLDFYAVEGDELDAPAGFLELEEATVRVSEVLEWVIDLEPLPGDHGVRPVGGFVPSEPIDGVVTFRTTDASWNGGAWMRSVPPHFRTPYLRPVWHEVGTRYQWVRSSR